MRWWVFLCVRFNIRHIWLWVKANGTILGEVDDPFQSILVGIGLLTGGSGG